MQLFTVYSENHRTHISTSYGQNVEFFRVKVGGTYSYYCISVG